MKDTFEFTLNNPLTEEQWDMISDVDFDRTDRITFHTKHGKEVEFIKVIRCKDCKYGKEDEDGTIECTFWDFMDHTHHNDPEGFCYRAKRRGEE